METHSPLIPIPFDDEIEGDFISRCMCNEGAMTAYPEKGRRLIECRWEWALKDPENANTAEGWIVA